MITKYIKMGQMLPAYYGIAWHQFDRDIAVCLPVPLNLVVAILRNIYSFIKFGHIRVFANQRDAYRQGYSDGKNAKDKK